jgi:integrase/recombinase XerD
LNHNPRFRGIPDSTFSESALKAVRALIRFAIYNGDIAVDPSESIKTAKAGIKSKGHMTWLAPQIAQYRERWPLGTVARLALELLLNIAARRYDAHELGAQHIRDGRLIWRPHKTLRSTGKLLSIRIRSELQAAMDAVG